MSERRIFLSYSWDDKTEANHIDNIFMRFNIELTRDIRDLKYDVNIHAFMDNLQKHDKLLLFVSDSYLRSVNCMYEAAKALDIPEKIVIIVKEGVNLWDVGYKAELLSYWEQEYQKTSTWDAIYFQQEIEDTKLAYSSIGRFIDFAKQNIRMNENTLDFDILFKELQVERQYPTVITDEVFDWVARYPNARLSDVSWLIGDLYSSKKIRISDYPEIPDNETDYLFKSIDFASEKNGITLNLAVTDRDTGRDINIRYSRLVEIEENDLRSESHSKYYLRCENPAKKQQYYEAVKRKDNGFSDVQDIERISHGYTDTFRITLFR